jgi:hypothetical protein
MTRKRYRYDPESGEMIETTALGRQRSATATGALWNDSQYHGLRATDGTDISSRKKHREYMKRNGLTTADDFNSSWARAKEERERYMRHGGSVRKQDIVQAIQQLSQRNR